MDQYTPRFSQSPQCDSTNGLHFLQNKEYANNYNNQQFSILARARSAFHLSALEVTYIKTFKSILCRQKEFVYYVFLN